MDKHDNPLKNAPHTHKLSVRRMDAWLFQASKPSSRWQGNIRNDKYWPPVARVDNVFGDRNLVCSCPPIENYMQAAE